MKKLMLWIALIGMGSGVIAQTTTTPAPKANAPQENKMSDKSSKAAPTAKANATPSASATAKAAPPKKQNKKQAEHKDVKSEKKAPEAK